MSEHNQVAPPFNGSAAPLAAVRGENARALLMSRLIKAAEAGDADAFLRAHEELEVEALSAADFRQLLQLALTAGAYLAARAIAAQGANHYPADAELQKYAYVLAPPSLAGSSPPRAVAIKANQYWLNQHSPQYQGQWVALKNGQLLGADNALEALVKKVGSLEGVLLTIAY